LPVAEIALIAVLDFQFSGLSKKSYKNVNNKLLVTDRKPGNGPQRPEQGPKAALTDGGLRAVIWPVSTWFTGGL